MSAGGHSMVGQVVLGRYRIMRPLAQGGMGVIYLGRVEGAAGFAKPVVLKTVIPHLVGDSSLAGMFVREARILSNLQHPAIVGVLDFGEIGDAYLMVLEYVHGYHLGQWIRYLGGCKRAMEVDHAIHIASHVLDALQYAHRMKGPDGTALEIVHRDVSPSNILIDAYGHVKLHDFGIARMREENAEYKTEAGTFKGTLAFAAPEVIQGLGATPRSDIYSCAVVLYLMLAGKNPFKGAQASETLYRVLSETPPPISARRDDVPETVEAAIFRALEKKPQDRFATAAAFAEALRVGRHRSEDEIADEFAGVVGPDFLGEMPEKLGLESLAIRDQSWREAQEGPPAVRVPLSVPPPKPSSSAPPTLNAPIVILSSRPPVSRTAETAIPPAWHRGRRRRGRWMALGASAVVLAGGAAAAIVLTRRTPAPPPPSIVVVDRQSAAEPTAAEPSSAPAAAPQATPAETASAQAAPARSAAATPAPAKTGSDAAALSHSFQRQQGRVEQCFARFANDVEGQPRIAVRFSVDAKGAVEKAELSPASLGGTELGGCILGAARSTQFGAQPEPLTFTIPITARRSK